MTTWTAGPHGPIEQLAGNLWRVEAPLKSPPIPRVMAVARRADGDLVVHSAIALGDADMDRLDALGPVRWVLVPNGFHRIDAPAFNRRYPAARVLCPAAARKRVAAVVSVDGAYEDFPADRDVRLEMIEGTGGAEGAMIVRSADGVTVVVNDVVFNLPHRPGLSGFVLRHLTRSTGGPRVSRLARLTLVKDAGALRAHLLRLAETADLRRLVVSHSEPVLDDAAGALRQAAATL
jgi:hypothetical protein